MAYTEVANEACASALGNVMPAVLPSWPTPEFRITAWTWKRDETLS